MPQDTTIQKRFQRIGEILGQIESTADPSTRALAKELLELLMAFHGAALERLLEIAFSAGTAGETLIREYGTMSWSAACCCTVSIRRICALA